MRAARKVAPDWLSEEERYRFNLVISGDSILLRGSLRGTDFTDAMKHGKSVRGRCLNVIIRSAGSNRARLGLIVPKRLLSRAVDRNRLKRILREWFRSQHDRLQGKDCVVRITAPVQGSIMENKLRAELDSFTTDP